MKKIILTLSILVLSVASCSKNDDDIPTPENVETPTIPTDSNILPKKIIYIDEEGESSSTFSYNDNKLVGGTFSGDLYSLANFVYTYDGDLITKIEWFEEGVLTDKHEFLYEKNKLKTSIYNRNDLDFETGELKKIVTKREYTHNNDGTILEEYFDFVNGEYVKRDKNILYTIINGNITKRIENSPHTSSYFYEYDNKNNPFKNITGYDKIGFSNVDDSGYNDVDSFFSMNNIVKKTNQFENIIDDQIIPQKTIQDYVLTYNPNGHLSERKQTYDYVIDYSDNNLVPVKTDVNRITKYFYE